MTEWDKPLVWSGQGDAQKQPRDKECFSSLDFQDWKVGPQVNVRQELIEGLKTFNLGASTVPCLSSSPRKTLFLSFFGVICIWGLGLCVREVIIVQIRLQAVSCFSFQLVTPMQSLFIDVVFAKLKSTNVVVYGW